MRLVLASASPRRADLLRAAGLTFDVRISEVDERLLPGETPSAYVERLARAKARAVAAHLGGEPALVLAADTTVVVDGDVFGKPEDAGDASRMLRRLSGRPHEVLTGVALAGPAGVQSFVDMARVWMRGLDDAEIAWYVESGEPMGKAGGYAIQGLASRFIPRIEGSYATVVGLPVARVCRLLGELGAGI